MAVYKSSRREPSLDNGLGIISATETASMGNSRNNKFTRLLDTTGTDERIQKNTGCDIKLIVGVLSAWTSRFSMVS